MVGDMTDNGRKIICMVMEFTLGQMAEGTKEIMKMIRKMDKALTNGLMVDTT